MPLASAIRQRSHAFIVMILVVVMLTAFTVPTARAAVGSVTGTVTIEQDGVTAPYPGVTIKVVEAGGTFVHAETTSSADGSFTVDVEGGTYDIVAEPPDSSGFTPATRDDLVVPDGGSAQADFLFIVPQVRVAIVGTITHSSGSPAAGVDVTIADRTDTTAADGTYQVDILPRTDHFLSVDAGGVAGLPDTYFLSTTDQLSLLTGATIDVTLPSTEVDIAIVDTRTDPVWPSWIETAARVSGPAVHGVATSIQVTKQLFMTAAGGTATMRLPAGAYVVKAYPDNSLGLLDAEADLTMPMGDTFTIVLDDEPPPPDTTDVTARVLHGGGGPMEGVDLVVIGGGSGRSDTDGVIDFESLIVTGRLDVRATGGDKLPKRLSIRTIDPVALAGPSFDVGDIMIPTLLTTFDVTDPDGNPVVQAGIRLLNTPTATGLSVGPYAAEGTSGQASTDPPWRTDTAGSAGLWLLDANPRLYGADVRAIGCSEPGVTWALDPTFVSFQAGDTIDVRLTGSPCPPPAPDPIDVSGTLLYHGVGLGDFDISVAGVVHDTFENAETDVDGYYWFEDGLVPDEYTFEVNAYLSATLHIVAETIAAAFEVPDADEYEIPLIDIGSLDRDLAEMTIRVLDQANRPIPGVRVVSVAPRVNGLVLAGADAFGISNDSGVTDSSGTAVLRLFSTSSDGGFDQQSTSTGKYRFALTPPAQFEPVTLLDVGLPSGGATFTVKLVDSHAPPVTDVAFVQEANTDGAYPDPVTLILSATAATGFDVTSIEYELDGGATQTYAGSFPVVGFGAHSIAVWATDSGSVSSVPVVSAFEIQGPDSATTTTTQPTTTTTAAPASTTTTSIAGEQLPATGPPGDFGILSLFALALLAVGALALRANREIRAD